MMRVWSYIISNPDEVPVLTDALASLSRVSDRIFVVDGGLGGGTLNHHPTHTQPLSEWMITRPEHPGWFQISQDERHGMWNDVPLTLYNRPFDDPAHQRNWVQERMESLPDQPDWYLWIDSDEVLSWQFVGGLQEYLKSLPEGITNICPKYLALVQDEQHYVPQQSNWLSHGRLYRPRTTNWSGSWHEHQNYVGARELWDVRIIHLRAFYRRRLLVQRGHPMVTGKRSPLWSNIQIEPIPNGVTWPALHYPEDEIIPFPFEEDASEVWDFNTGKLISQP